MGIETVEASLRKEQGENHGNRNSGGIIEKMEEGG